MNKKDTSLLTIAFLLAILAIAITVDSAFGQATIIGTAGGSTSGLGSKAGGSVGMDLDIRRNKAEVISRFTYSVADKIGSGPSSKTLSERVIIRYGDRWLIGGGVFVGHVTGAFGSRTAVAPLIHGGYRYQREAWQAVAYVSVRPFEVGTNYTGEHRTRGAEVGLELRQFWGRLVTSQTFGTQILSYHNLDNGPQHLGASSFVRGGVGVRF